MSQPQPKKQSWGWSVQERTLPFELDGNEQAPIVGADAAPSSSSSSNGSTTTTVKMVAVTALGMLGGFALGRITAPRPAAHVLLLLPPERPTGDGSNGSNSGNDDGGPP